MINPFLFKMNLLIFQNPYKFVQLFLRFSKYHFWKKNRWDMEFLKKSCVGYGIFAQKHNQNS